MKMSASKPDPVYKLAKKLVNKRLTSIEKDRSTDGSLSDDQVHKIRVCTKKLRALLLLYRPCCSKKNIKAVDKIIREFARSYAGLRDAHVQYLTLSRATEQFDLEDKNDMQPLLDYYHPAKRNTEDQDRPIDPHSGFEHILQTWNQRLKPDAATDFKPGVDYTYRKARKLAIKAKSKNQDKAYHRCRKWVKYYMYQLKMLVRKKNDKDKSYIRKLASLGELLGELHDTCVLEQTLKDLMDTRNVNNQDLKNTSSIMLSRLAELKQREKAQCNELFEELFTPTHNPVKL